MLKVLLFLLWFNLEWCCSLNKSFCILVNGNKWQQEVDHKPRLVCLWGSHFVFTECRLWTISSLRHAKCLVLHGINVLVYPSIQEMHLNMCEMG